MNTLIVYASSHGTTEKVAVNIAKSIAYNVQTRNLKKPGKINLKSIDQVIIGGSIHAGSMQRAVKEFCKRYMSELLEKRIALFMCGLNIEDLDNEFKNGFPEQLRIKAISSKMVGGEYIFEKMNFLERAIIKKITGITESASMIKYEKIDELVKEIGEN